MSETVEDILAHAAVTRGFVTRDQLADARQVQERAATVAKMKLDLFEVLTKQGVLKEKEIDELAAIVAKERGEIRRVGRYEVVEKLGQGGMGAVYKARDTKTGEFVSLKLLPPSAADPDSIARFQREADVARTLNHENIVKYVEFGRDASRDVYFCALEYIEGRNIYQLLREQGHFPERQALKITRQIARALQHAHANGLVHRDVKPDNIIVSSDGTAKLLDLGLARPTEDVSRLTMAGHFVGSPHYASPEQARGVEDIDTRSDIYSLGATLYHMVTGYPPFEGKSSLEILSKHINEVLEWPGDVNEDLSDDTCMMIAKMMAKERDDRYALPREVVAHVDLILSGSGLELDDAILEHSSVAPTVTPRPGRLHRVRPPTRMKQKPASGRFDPDSRDRSAAGSGRLRRSNASSSSSQRLARASGSSRRAAGSQSGRFKTSGAHQRVAAGAMLIARWRGLSPRARAFATGMMITLFVILVVGSVVIATRGGSSDRRSPPPPPPPAPRLQPVQVAPR